MNKKVNIRGETYRMYQAQTGWIFVESKKTRRTYSIAKIQGGSIVEIDSEPALGRVSNEELAQAWLEQ